MSTPAGNRTWKHRLKQVLLIGLLACAGFSGWIFWRIFLRVSDEIPTTYAGWAAWELIDAHLTTHFNQWPHGIFDLRAAVPVHRSKGGDLHWSVDDLTNRIAIDWNVDVEALRASAKSQPSHPLLVTRRDGKPINSVWKGVEPNRKLEEILGLPAGFLRATN